MLWFMTPQLLRSLCPAWLPGSKLKPAALPATTSFSNVHDRTAVRSDADIGLLSL